MPKQTVSKEEILKIALQMTRESGFASVNARSVAKRMGYSVQPIYSYFNNMEALKENVYGAAMEFYNEFIYSRVKEDGILESMARANVAFAKYETNLFKLLFFQKLSGLNSFNDIYEWMGDKQATKQLAEKLSLTEEKVKEVYIMLIVFTHGVATMLATGGANISNEECAAILERAYNAFVKAQK
ncbi:MAG: TetR/AcrR family transcriptional regulator [Clostridia bacterium]|nr:TetR/AcrR family transcriptional regulator [Clostridia bacterium]MDE7328537.1 TetR/AcrR family transcriptional regulator [Clostridia bacterium]